jgi:hypothetical protein
MLLLGIKIKWLIFLNKTKIDKRIKTLLSLFNFIIPAGTKDYTLSFTLQPSKLSLVAANKAEVIMIRNNDFFFTLIHYLFKGLINSSNHLLASSTVSNLFDFAT